MKSVEFKVYFQTGYFSELYPMFNPSEFLAVNNTKKLFGLGVILMNIEIVEYLKIPEHHTRKAMRNIHTVQFSKCKSVFKTNPNVFFHCYLDNGKPYLQKAITVTSLKLNIFRSYHIKYLS